MKGVLFLFFAVVFIISCKKDKIELRKGLLGTWELRESSGSIAGYTHKYSPGNGNTITFLDSSHFKGTYADNDTIAEGGGIYLLSIRSDCNGNPTTVISYPPNSFFSAISVSNDTLHIDDYCVSDGVYNTYIKIK